MSHNVRISKLTYNQAHDPQRGPFHVKPKPNDKQPRHYRGERVYKDAFGNLFTVEPA